MLTLTIPSRGAYKLGDNTEDHPGFGVYISTCIEPRRLKSEVHGVDGRDDIDREDGPLEMVVIGRHVSPNFSPQSSPSVQSSPESRFCTYPSDFLGLMTWQF